MKGLKKTVQVILKDEVIGLGVEGEIKKVKKGFARNYLIPKSLAVYKTPINLKKLEESMQEILKRRLEKEQQYLSLAEKMEGVEIHFYERVSKSSVLFGSINKTEIFHRLYEKFASELDKSNVTKSSIKLDKPIKQLGTYIVDCQLYHNQKVQIKVLVSNIEDLDKDKSLDDNQSLDSQNLEGETSSSSIENGNDQANIENSQIQV